MRMHRVTSIKKVEPFNVLIEFDHNELRWLAMEARLREWAEGDETTPYAKLLHPKAFEQVRLNPIAKTLEWPNGVDLCPDQLYNWSEKTTNYGA